LIFPTVDHGGMSEDRNVKELAWDLDGAPYRCPVCEESGLGVKPYETWPPPPGLVLRPPYEDLLGRASYEVCPCCGFEFGHDDNPGTGATAVSFAEYRTEWEAEGRPRFTESS